MAQFFSDTLTSRRSGTSRPDAGSRKRLVLEGATVGFGAFLLLFQATPIGVAISLAGLAVFLVAGLRAAIQKSVRAYGMTYFELVMAVTCTFSALAFYFVGFLTSAQFTVIFSVTVLSVSLIARGYSAEGLLRWAAISHLIMILAVTMVNPVEIMGALDPNAANRWALRFRPFGLHPNLTGFIFSGAVIILIYGAVINPGKMRVLYCIGAVLSFLTVLVASARGGLLALVLSSALMALFYYRRVFAPRPRMTIFMVALSVIFLALAWGTLSDYLVNVLELNSRSRGLDSGGSGRIDRWLSGLNFIGDSDLQLFIGMGLRTVGQDTLGFNSTENSYINIAIENGLFVMVASLVLFFGGIIRLYMRSLRDLNPVWTFLTWLLLYACIQSFFNRYLLAIGNSLSFYVLLTTAIAWLPQGPKLTRTVRQLMPWEVDRRKTERLS